MIGVLWEFKGTSFRSFSFTWSRESPVTSIHKLSFDTAGRGYPENRYKRDRWIPPSRLLLACRPNQRCQAYNQRLPGSPFSPVLPRLWIDSVLYCHIHIKYAKLDESSDTDDRYQFFKELYFRAIKCIWLRCLISTTKIQYEKAPFDTLEKQSGGGLRLFSTYSRSRPNSLRYLRTLQKAGLHYTSLLPPYPLHNSAGVK